jgi:PAS domain-containing protein
MGRFKMSSLLAEIVGTVETILGITDRKRTEENQRQREEKFRAFVETTNEWTVFSKVSG